MNSQNLISQQFSKQKACRVTHHLSLKEEPPSLVAPTKGSFSYDKLTAS
jgi:hypothetical protein